MIKLYKNGKFCFAELHQVKLMEEAGWSKNEPQEKPKEPQANQNSGGQTQTQPQGGQKSAGK